MTLIVTNFGAFSGSGSTRRARSEFHAGFYVTGWFHQQPARTAARTTTCRLRRCARAGRNDTAATAATRLRTQNKGNAWGYFVTTVLPVPGSIVSEVRCEFGELGTCAARLVE